MRTLCAVCAIVNLITGMAALDDGDYGSAIFRGILVMLCIICTLAEED